MASSCELLDAELALDRVAAELARELPPHVRAFAAAYAAGRAEPAAPAVLARPATLEIARRALAHPLLAERALALLRLAVPVALHVPAHGDYRAMLAARDAIAQRLFGMSALELVHRLHGSAAPGSSPGEVPQVPPGWREPDGRLLDPHAAWRALEAKHGVAATVTFATSAQRARTFVVGARECVVVVPPRVDSPAARFVVMHELGHVLAACLSPPGIPRTLDEAVAALAASSDEPIAIAARVRRLALARQLDAVERGAATIADVPWSLWNDPGAQAAYVAAEQLADELAASDLRGAIAAQRDRIDRATVL